MAFIPSAFGNTWGRQTEVRTCGLVYYGTRQSWEWVFREAPVPLVSVDVKASVVHAVAQVEVCQVYVNSEDQPIECVYYFPVSADGAVTHFHAELEGRIIQGRVNSNNEAEEEYNTAVANQQTAFLGEETKPDLFKLRVGFLRPGEKVKVVIGYVTEVKNEPGSNSIRFFLPTTIVPRYVSPRDTDPKSRDISQMQFTNAGTSRPLSIQVAVCLQGGIKSVESPSHKVQVSMFGPIPENQIWHKALVGVVSDISDMNRDFVLNIVPEEVHKPRLYSEKAEDGSTAVMLHLVPSFKLDEQKSELIFVLDRSGSMQGRSIELAKEALLVFLHSMPADCYFNVIGFGSSFETLFQPFSGRYDAGNLQYAANHARHIQANMGGTELLNPLRHIYATPNIPGYLRQIFVLTDGAVSNTEAVLGMVQANSHKSRVFALGIGEGASQHLVDGLAKAGGGTAAFVTSNESIHLKVLNQLKNGLQPSLTDIELEWEGVKHPPVQTGLPPVNKEKTLLGYNKPVVEQVSMEARSRQSPRFIPPVYDGSQLLVFGLFQGDCPTAVNVKAASPDGPLALRIEHMEAYNLGSTNMIHLLAAVKLIRELEMESNALSFQMGGGWGKSEELKNEIIHIGCKNGITSKFTSFIAVDSNEGESKREYSTMRTRVVPAQLPQRRFDSSSSCFGFGSISQQRQQQYQQQSQIFSGASVFAGANQNCYSIPRIQQSQVHQNQAAQCFSFSTPRQSEPGCMNAAPTSTFSFGGQQQQSAMSANLNPTTFGYTPYGCSPSAVNTALNSGFGTLFGSSSAASSGVTGSCDSEIDGAAAASVDPWSSQTFKFGFGHQRLHTDSISSVPPGSSSTSSPTLNAIYLQEYDGSYNLNEGLSQIVGRPVENMKRAASDYKLDERVFATALAIVYFENNATAEKDVWDLVVKKARKWLGLQIQENLIPELLQVARLFMGISSA